MIINMYSIKDSLAEEFGPVFMAKNDQVAKRQVFNLLIDVPDSALDDYVLYQVGEFDTSNGQVSALNYKVIPYVNELKVIKGGIE